MYKINKDLLPWLLFLVFVILILLFSFLVTRNIFAIENFVDNAGTSAAFAIPTLTKWSFNKKIYVPSLLATSDDLPSDWFRLKKGLFYVVPFKDFKFSATDTKPNKSISISFLIKVVGGSGTWREVFRFNDGKNHDCCDKGDRIPSFWVFNNFSSKFHIKFATDQSGDQGFDPPTEIPMAEAVLITLVINENNVKQVPPLPNFEFYVNNDLSYSGYFKNLKPRTIDSKLFLGEKFDKYGADGNILIKNFTVYDGVLSKKDVENIYNKLQEGLAGPAGAIGPAGPQGVAGLAGVAGGVGPPGVAGGIGAQGVAGSAGPAGPIGPAGPKGPQGMVGPAGAQGLPGPGPNTTPQTVASTPIITPVGVV